MTLGIYVWDISMDTVWIEWMKEPDEVKVILYILANK